MLSRHKFSLSAAFAAGFILLAGSAAMASEQSSGNSGTIRGTVQDPSGALIANATVEIENPVSHYTQSVKTDSQGAFQLPNLPFNNYHLTVSEAGFDSAVQDVDVHS